MRLHAHALLDDPCDSNTRRGRAGVGSTLRSELPGLPPGLEVGRCHMVRLTLCVLGPMRDEDGAEPGHVPALPIWAAVAAGIAGPASAPRRGMMVRAAEPTVPRL